MFKSILEKGSALAAMTAFRFRKYGPEIALAAGAIAVVSGCVLACRQTLYVEGIVDEAKEKIDTIKASVGKDTQDPNTGELIPYTQELANKDLTTVYFQTGAKFIKNYIVPITLITGGMALMVGGHVVLLKRTIALGSALAAVRNDFWKYRQNVIADQGVAKDTEYRVGKVVDGATVVKTEMDENGELKTTEEKEKIFQSAGLKNKLSFFYENCGEYSKRDANANFNWARQVQDWAQRRLYTKHIVFLDEVADQFDYQYSSPEERKLFHEAGWVYKHNGTAVDNLIDLGLTEIKNAAVKRFAQGLEPNFLFTPNCTPNVMYAG